MLIILATLITQLHEAFSTLFDESKRRVYDRDCYPLLRQAKGNAGDETDTQLAKKFRHEQTERENVLRLLLKQKLELDEDIADAKNDLGECEAALKALEGKSTSAVDEDGPSPAEFLNHLLSGGLEAVQPTSDSQTTKKEWHALVLEAQIKQEKYAIEKLESRRRPLESEIARITAEMRHAQSVEDARAAAVLGEKDARNRAEEAQRQSHEAQALREAEAKAKTF
jgi:ATP-dependent Clp protease ATP-binding subunit ClpA